MRSIPLRRQVQTQANNNRNRLRTLWQPTPRAGAYLPGSSTIYAQFWQGQSLWRPSAAWAIVAALLAIGTLQSWNEIQWQQLTLLWLLCDLLWGGIWRLSGGRDQLLPLRSQPGSIQARLPYLQPDSPAAQLFSWNEADVWPWLLRVGLPTTLVALLVASTLGQMALLLTLAIVAITVLGWIIRRTFEQPPALLHALVTIALPWLLVLWHHGITPNNDLWMQHLALPILWTLHHWGEGRILCFENDWIGAALIGLTDVALIVLLVVWQAPFALALLAMAMLPSWIATLRSQPLAGIAFWWWLAMLISALAISG